jgi:hypothetical protein
VGTLFTFNEQVLFDSSGNVTHHFASGLVEKIPLLDGSLFISAGRLDFTQHRRHRVAAVAPGFKRETTRNQRSLSYSVGCRFA